MKYIQYKSITGLHLEVTTKCNAVCAMCSRNYRGKTRRGLQLVELTLNDCKKIFKPNFIKQLKIISLCGVYGDPINAKEIIEIVDYFYQMNPEIVIHLYTNGSLHGKDWWTRLAKSLKHGYVIFGIDGIGTTHSFHRGNTDYKKVIENAVTYIGAGGKAKWDFIAFRHNENQIPNAKQLSSDLGFSSFQVKKTSRFLKHLFETDNALDSTFCEYGRHPVFNSNETVIGYLETPIKDENKNSSEKELFSLIEKYGSIERYFDDTTIKCQAIDSGGVFVSAFGEVFPCCTIYQQVCYGKFYGVKDASELNEYNIYVNENISALEQSIEDIVEGNFFKKIQENWTLSTIMSGKPKACCRSCGDSMNLHNSQHN